MCIAAPAKIVEIDTESNICAAERIFRILG